MRPVAYRDFHPFYAYCDSMRHTARCLMRHCASLYYRMFTIDFINEMKRVTGNTIILPNSPGIELSTGENRKFLACLEPVQIETETRDLFSSFSILFYREFRHNGISIS